jgi:flavin reductase
MPIDPGAGVEQPAVPPRSGPTIDEFKTVLGRFATGVAVMTTVAARAPHGMTANAISSVSLDPLLVLVCVERSAVMADRVAASGTFALSFLAADQDDLSVWFSQPPAPGQSQFSEVPTFVAATGAPLLQEAVGWVDCQVWASYDGGDHVIVVGEVLDVGVGSDRDPLLYYRSGYGRFAP